MNWTEWLKKVFFQLLDMFLKVGLKGSSTNATDEEKLRALITKNSPDIGPKMLKMASKWFFHPKITNRAYMVLVDFDYRETSPRMWVVNRMNGKSEVFKVAHGDKSDPDQDGYATEFSNISGSHQSSLGAMVTGKGYNSTKFKHSMRIYGLQQGLNHLVYSRAIVWHSSNYVNDVKGRLIGDSWGCFAVSEKTAERVLPLIDDGALLFAYHKSLDEMFKEPKSNKLDRAVELIKKWEGLRLVAYLDPVGIPTIGFGTIQYPDGRKVQRGDRITEQEAEDFLIDHMEKDIIPHLDAAVKVQLTEGQYNALVSFIYNVGAGAFKASTMLKKINVGDFDGAAREFDRWVYAGGKKLNGLVNRRKDEKEMFLS